MMGLGMKISISMSLFFINLMGERAIRKARDKNIKKGERVILLNFHSKLNIGGRRY